MTCLQIEIWKAGIAGRGIPDPTGPMGCILPGPLPMESSVQQQGQSITHIWCPHPVHTLGAHVLCSVLVPTSSTHGWCSHWVPTSGGICWPEAAPVRFSSSPAPPGMGILSHHLLASQEHPVFINIAAVTWDGGRCP